MPTPRSTVWLLAVLGGLVEGCTQVPLDPPAVTVPAATTTLHGPPALDAHAHADVRGVVTDRVATAPYTYFRVSPPAGPARWVVTMGECPPAGTPVVVDVMGKQDDFYSRRLDRTFDELLFGIATTADPEA